MEYLLCVKLCALSMAHDLKKFTFQIQNETWLNVKGALIDVHIK